MALKQKSLIRYRFNGATCPACGEDCTGHAALWPDGNKSIMCIHTAPDQAPDGWMGIKKDGGWTLFWANSDAAKQQWMECVEECEQSKEFVNQGTKSEKGFVRKGKTLIPQNEIDAFMEWAGDTFSPTHREWSVAYQDLQRRGLSDAQIQTHNILDFNIPSQGLPTPDIVSDAIIKLFGPFTLKRINGGCTVGALTYYAIPIFDFDGKVTGFQKRNHQKAIEKAKEKGKKLGKYVWAGNYSHKGQQWTAAESLTGTPPLQVAKGDEDCRTLLLTEGVLKPLIVWENLDRQYHVMGAAGGAFSASSGLLLASLMSFKIHYNIEQVVWLADPGSYQKKEDGSFRSSNVVANIASTQQFCEEHGFRFSVADWGQLVDKDCGLDPDEIPAKTILDVLPQVSPSPKEQLSRLVANTVAGKSALRIDYETAATDRIESYQAETIDEVIQLYGKIDKKFILNNTSLGSGKSYSVDSTPIDRFSKHYYVSLSPRNPTIDAIEDNFFKLEGRHSGLVWVEGVKTPNGMPVTRRPKNGETPHTEANCAFAEEHTTARLNGLDSAKICMDCPFRNECIAGTHEHYNYLFTRIEAEKSPKVRASIATLNPSKIDESCIITIDEPTSSAPFAEEFSITAQEARKYMMQINSVLGREAFAVDLDMIASFDSVQDVLTAARQVDADIQEEIKRKYFKRNNLNSHYAGTKAICYRWVTILLNPHIKWNLKNGKYSCLTTNQHVQDIIHSAGKTIILDATAEPEVIAAQYGIPLEDLAVIRNTDKATSNVTVKVLVTDGFNSRKQSIATKKKIIPEVKQLLNSTHGEENVGFIAHSEYCEPGDIVFFSEHRGSNRFQNMKAICMFGLPQIDLGAAEQQWQLIKDSLPSWDFRTYYNHLTHSEIKQGIGRVRGFRRQEEQLTAYIVANCRLGRLEKEGYKVDYKIAALAGVKSAYTPQITAIEDIYRAASSLHTTHKAITNSALAQVLNKDRKNVSRTLKRLNITLEELNDFFSIELLPGNFGDIPSEVVNAVVATERNKLVPERTYSLFDSVSVEAVMQTVRTLIEGVWPKGFKRAQINTLLNGIAYRMRTFLNMPKHLQTDFTYAKILDSIVSGELEGGQEKETETSEL